MADNLNQKSPPKGSDNTKLFKSLSITASEAMRLIERDKKLGIVHPARPTCLISNSTPVNQRNKTSSFQITSIKIDSSRTSSSSRTSDGDFDDSADDLDESHTDDFSIDNSRITDIENETPSFSEDTSSKDDNHNVNPMTNPSFNSVPVIATTQSGGAISTQTALTPGLVADASSVLPATNSVTAAGSNAGLVNADQSGNAANNPTKPKCDTKPPGARFKVVKIESAEPFKRGRWMCMDYLDCTLSQHPHSQHIKVMKPMDNKSSTGTIQSKVSDSSVFASDSTHQRVTATFSNSSGPMTLAQQSELLNKQIQQINQQALLNRQAANLQAQAVNQQQRSQMANQQPQIANQPNQQTNQPSQYVQPQQQNVQQQQVQHQQPAGQQPLNQQTIQVNQQPIQLSQQTIQGNQQTIQSNQLPIQPQQMVTQQVVQQQSGGQQNISAIPQNIPTQQQYVPPQQQTLPQVGQVQGQSMSQVPVAQVAPQQQIQGQSMPHVQIHQQQPQQLQQFTQQQHTQLHQPGQAMSQATLQQQSSQQQIQGQSLSQTQQMPQQQLQGQSLPVAGLQQQIQQLPQQQQSQQHQLSQQLSGQSLPMMNQQQTQRQAQSLSQPVQQLSQQLQAQSLSQVPGVLLQTVSQAMQHQTLQPQQLQQVIDTANMQQIVNQASVSQQLLQQQQQQQQQQQFQGAQYYGQTGAAMQMMSPQNRGLTTATISSTLTPIVSVPLQQQTMLPQSSTGISQTPQSVATQASQQQQQIQQQQLQQMQQLQQQQQQIQQQILNQQSLNAYPSQQSVSVQQQQFPPVQQQQQLQQQQFPVQQQQFVQQQFPMHQVSMNQQFPVQQQQQPQQLPIQQQIPLQQQQQQVLQQHQLMQNYQNMPQQGGQQQQMHVGNVSQASGMLGQAPAFGGVLGMVQGNPMVQQMLATSATLPASNYVYQVTSSGNQSEPYYTQAASMTVTSGSANPTDGTYVVGHTASPGGVAVAVVQPVPPAVQQQVAQQVAQQPAQQPAQKPASQQATPTEQAQLTLPIAAGAGGQGAKQRIGDTQLEPLTMNIRKDNIGTPTAGGDDATIGEDSESIRGLARALRSSSRPHTCRPRGVNPLPSSLLPPAQSSLGRDSIPPRTTSQITPHVSSAPSLLPAASTAAAPPQPALPESDKHSASGNNAVAIDNKIEQAMDLVKSHLMFAVREEVEVLKEKIAELMERISHLEVENNLLRSHATPETLSQLSNLPSQQPPGSVTYQQPPNGSVS